MDSPKLPDKLKIAGADFYSQLKGLGLKPEGILWMYEFDRSQFVLWLIWSGIDRVGPLAVSEMLFKAYNASALTQEIDPFSVTVKSPKQVIAHAIFDAMDSRHHISPGGQPLVSFQLRTQPPAHAGDDDNISHQWDIAWVYHWQDKPRKTLDVARDWRRFTANVDKLAA